MFKIVETFYSIQGEGTFAGTPALFIRFFGCNLKCDFGNGFVCDDTAHANKDLVRQDSIKQLVDLAQATPTKHIVLTGGEVSMQDVNDLITELKVIGKYIQVETNGFKYDNIKTANFITYSPKMQFDSVAPNMKAGFHELKLLAGVNQPVNIEQWRSVKTKYVQPIGNENSWDDANVKYCINFVKNNPEWKLSLQTHKAIGVR